MFKLCKWILAQLVLFIFFPFPWTAGSWPGLIGTLCIYSIFIILVQTSLGTWVRRFRHPKTVRCLLLLCCFLAIKTLCVWGFTSRHGEVRDERQDILQRRDYLAGKFVNATPREVLDLLPSSIGPQFQGEWALYSCSMFATSLANISRLYPETTKENLHHIQKLIGLVLSSELRAYDTERWDEDALTSLHHNTSHLSYISHLAWMICNYKNTGGDERYDQLLSDLCRTLNRRILASPSLNLPTYPDEDIYIPDMLVAIVVLHQYAQMGHPQYNATVDRWIRRAQSSWLDAETGLLVSTLNTDGTLNPDAVVKGSYSALSCYYLTLVNHDFAQQQYSRLKQHLWRQSGISGLREYTGWTLTTGIDVDAGPIIFGLSPSGTAFFLGPATYFSDHDTRSRLLTTAEIAGHTISASGTRHYLLAHLALVGEPIMLAMRTHRK